jgi:hypothetical protein
MTTTFLAHFDGNRSLVIDEPVDLPMGTPLRVQVQAMPMQTEATISLARLPLIHLTPADAEAVNRDPEFNIQQP